MKIYFILEKIYNILLGNDEEMNARAELDTDRVFNNMLYTRK